MTFTFPQDFTESLFLAFIKNQVDIMNYLKRIVIQCKVILLVIYAPNSNSVKGKPTTKHKN